MVDIEYKHVRYIVWLHVQEADRARESEEDRLATNKKML